MTADWSIAPREPDLTRLYDPLSRWTHLDLVERYNVHDSWTITGPPDVMSVFRPGSGCILDRNGEQVASGQVSGIQRGATKVDGRVVESFTVSFVGDLKLVGDRIVFPTPSHNLTADISYFSDAHDLRTGAIETLIIGYIRSHAGDLAQVDRRIPRLRIPTSLGRGGTTQVSARLDNLGVLATSLAEAGNLRIRVVHTEDSGGSWLELMIDDVQDVSDNVRFGTAGSTAAGIIDEWSYEIGMPTTTRAIIAGGGELTARDFLQIDDIAAETLWRYPVERMIDQRHIAPDSANKLAELTRSAEEALEEGAGMVKVAFEPILGPDLEYRRDVRVGDIVGYDLPGLDPAQDKIREAKTVVRVNGGEPTESVSVVVGTPDAPQSRSQQQTTKALREISVIQRSK